MVGFAGIGTNSENTNLKAQYDFILDSLPYIKDEDIRNKRFFYAFCNILDNKLGYVYEVLQIWDSDPVNNEYAKVLYPVYIFNKQQRDKEPSLYKIINQSMVKIFDLVPSYINSYSKGGTEDMDGIYVYVEPVDSKTFPLSVFRLKYKPNTEDTARWIEREKICVDEWKSLIEDVTDQYLCAYSVSS